MDVSIVPVNLLAHTCVSIIAHVLLLHIACCCVLHVLHVPVLRPHNVTRSGSRSTCSTAIIVLLLDLHVLVQGTPLDVELHVHVGIFIPVHVN